MDLSFCASGKTPSEIEPPFPDLPHNRSRLPFFSPFSFPIPFPPPCFSLSGTYSRKVHYRSNVCSHWGSGNFLLLVPDSLYVADRDPPHCDSTQLSRNLLPNFPSVVFCPCPASNFSGQEGTFRVFDVSVLKCWISGRTFLSFSPWAPLHIPLVSPTSQTLEVFAYSSQSVWGLHETEGCLEEEEGFPPFITHCGSSLHLRRMLARGQEFEIVLLIRLLS